MGICGNSINQSISFNRCLFLSSFFLFDTFLQYTKIDKYYFRLWLYQMF